MTAAGDTCKECDQFHEFVKGKDVMVLFWETPSCNHIESVCPNCDRITRIFIGYDDFLKVMNERTLTIRYLLDGTPEMIRAREELAEALTAADTAVDPPEPPDWMVRELHEQLREFEDNN